MPVIAGWWIDCVMAALFPHCSLDLAMVGAVVQRADCEILTRTPLVSGVP